jgi:molybdate transport system substrate-binding protein
MAASGCGAHSTAPAKPSVLLFVAASTADAVEEIKTQFEREHAVSVRLSNGASSELAQQVANGADADVFLSASDKWANFLVDEGFVAEQQDLLGNRLVVVVPLSSPLSIAQPEDLQLAEVEHLALADRAVPAGTYAEEALRNLDLLEVLEPKIVRGADVRDALVYVEKGQAEAGIVYATDAAISDKVRVTMEIDPTLTPPIRYPLVLTKMGAEKPEAQELYDYLSADSAAAVFRRYGFTVLTSRETADVVPSSSGQQP